MIQTVRHIVLDTVGSTNDEAMARLRAGEPTPFVVVARSQTGGRGRQGRAWASPAGNLYASVALRDPASPSQAPQLGFVAGVALAEALRDRLGGDARLTLKWPNDVLHDGAKLAGLLLESTTLADGALGCVVGLGVNVVGHPEGLAYPATDLAAAGDPLATPEAVLSAFLGHFQAGLALWARGAAFDRVRRAWLGFAAGLGGSLVVATPRRRVEGLFHDLDPTGRLLLDTRDGFVAIEAGDVFLPALVAAPSH